MKRCCLIFCLWLLTTASSLLAEETKFEVSPDRVKYHTADIEFRDSTGTQWPNFFHGKPASQEGFICIDPSNPGADFSLQCDRMAQEKGDQSRKVLGALKHPLIPLLTITGMSAPLPLVRDKNSSKDQNTRATHTATLTGTLELAGKKIAIKSTAEFWIHDGKGDQKSRALMLTATFAVKPADLGLKGDNPIHVRFGLTAFPASK